MALNYSTWTNAPHLLPLHTAVTVFSFCTLMKLSVWRHNAGPRVHPRAGTQLGGESHCMACTSTSMVAHILLPTRHLAQDSHVLEGSALPHCSHDLVRTHICTHAAVYTAAYALRIEHL
jgi:hypothetical protein